MQSGDIFGAPGEGATRTTNRSFTLAEALRGPQFYLICFDLLVGRVLGAGVFFHMLPVLKENDGGAINVAVAFMLPKGICEAVSSLFVGRLVDGPVKLKHLMAAANFLQFLITITFPFMNTNATAVTMGVARGLYQGLKQGVETAITPRFYGRQHIGKIQGVQRMVAIAGKYLYEFSCADASATLRGERLQFCYLFVSSFICAGSDATS